jgi:hypothetical protein
MGTMPAGNRVRQTNTNSTYTEYVHFGGQAMAEKNSDAVPGRIIESSSYAVCGRRVTQSPRLSNRFTRCLLSPSAWRLVEVVATKFLVHTAVLLEVVTPFSSVVASKKT